MDFHALSRKDLQILCKKNGIRANMTNAAMADALQALELVQGIEDMQLDSVTETAADVSLQSPMGESLRSVNAQRTGGRTSTRRKPMEESGSKEPEETPIASSVLTRRRRATKESSVRRICKEEGGEGEVNRLEVPKTPATRNGQTRTAVAGTGASARRGAESQDRDEKENEKPVDVGLGTYSTRRSTRLSGKTLEEVPLTITKSRGRKAAVKIMALSEESENESNDRSKKSDVRKEGERGALAKHVGEDLDQNPAAVAAVAAPVFPREDNPDGGEAAAAILELPPPTQEGFNQGDQESIEDDLGLPKTASESQNRDEIPTESSETEDNAAVISVEAASAVNQAIAVASPPPPPPAVLSSVESDDSGPNPVVGTDMVGEASGDVPAQEVLGHELENIEEGGSSSEAAEEIPVGEGWEEDNDEGGDADHGVLPECIVDQVPEDAATVDVLGHELENIEEGGSSCEAAVEIPAGKGWEEDNDEDGDTDHGVLPESIVVQVPEDDAAVDVPIQRAQDTILESLALRLQQNLTLKCNAHVEDEGTAHCRKSCREIIGYPIPVSVVCDEDATEQVIGLEASAEESEEPNADAGLQMGVENALDFSSDPVPPLEDAGLQAAAEESAEADADSGLKLGVEDTLDFLSDPVPPLEDATEGGGSSSPVPPLGLIPPSEVVGGSSSSVEETETNTSFGETETAPTTGESNNGADHFFSENPNHVSNAFDHLVLSRTPVSQRSNGVGGGASDPGNASGNKSNKSLRQSLSKQKTPIKSRIFEDIDKENKNDGAGSAKKESREFGSMRKVKKIALIKDVNKGGDSRQMSLKNKSMGQLKRMVKEKISEMNNKEWLDKRSPLQMLSDNCLSRKEDN